MKYTRYNTKPKKKNGNNLLFYFALTLLLALVLGTFFQKYFFQEGKGISFKQEGNESHSGNEDSVEDENLSGGSGEKDKSQELDKEGGKEDNKGVEVNGEEYKFYLVQCGVFKVKENADNLLNTLKSYGRPFTELDGDVTKVYFGVYSEKNIAEVQQLLSSKGMETSKVEICIPVDDLSVGQLCTISENMIEIMNKTNEAEVKSINTEDIKNWVAQLDTIDETMKQYQAVEELKVYINNLPGEVGKNEIQDGMELIYNKLKSYKK